MPPCAPGLWPCSESADSVAEPVAPSLLDMVNDSLFASADEEADCDDDDWEVAFGEGLHPIVNTMLVMLADNTAVSIHLRLFISCSSVLMIQLLFSDGAFSGAKCDYA
jgi:hypothetical protein